MKTSAIIPRPLYLNKILPYVDKNVIKVLTGQRRVGKSFILRAVEEQIRLANPNANFITINLEDFAFAHISDAEALNAEISQRLSESVRNYIFIDEIQEVKDFDRVIRSLCLDPRNDIYITGSNSAMFSAEMASRLAGRSVEVRIHPLSYAEFLLFHDIVDSDDAIALYLRYGGLPYLRNLPDQNTWTEYLTGIVDSLVYRDIVARHSIRNNDFLQRMMLYLADNIGRIFTAKRIADYLKSQQVGGTVAGVQKYVDYACQAFIVNKARRWDVEGKKYFEIGEKYFFEDLGMRNAIVGYKPMDIAGLLENTVYAKLLTDGYEVKIGVARDGKEIDFIAEKNGEKKYVQVAVNVYDEATAAREFGSLTSIPDNYEKMLITYRDSAPNTYQGVKMLSLRQFLLN